MDQRLGFALLALGVCSVGIALNSFDYKAHNPGTTMKEAFGYQKEKALEIFYEGCQNIKNNIDWVKGLYRKVF